LRKKCAIWRLSRQLVSLFAVSAALRGQAVEPTQSDEFEVASIHLSRPGDTSSSFNVSHGRFAAHNVTVKSLIIMAFGVLPSQIIGTPSWVDGTNLDINATYVENTALPRVDINVKIRQLLIDRLMMKSHWERKRMPVYALETSERAFKLTNLVDCLPGSSGGGAASFKAKGASMNALSRHLSTVLQRVVVDYTGIKGCYDLSLTWRENSDTSELGESNSLANDSRLGAEDRPTLSDVLKDQLGVRLERTEEWVQVVAIDHIEHISEN
jgi:uncharacterized protein (TIGR03435 family)